MNYQHLTRDQRHPVARLPGCTGQARCAAPIDCAQRRAVMGAYLGIVRQVMHHVFAWQFGRGGDAVCGGGL